MDGQSNTFMRNGFPPHIIINRQDPSPKWEITKDSLPVEEVADKFIQHCIDEKNNKINSYKKNTGTEDIRLLICASFTSTSSSLRPSKGFSPNIHEFTRVYFSYFPYGVWEYPAGTYHEFIYSASFP